jgi:hypothetical protein
VFDDLVLTFVSYSTHEHSLPNILFHFPLFPRKIKVMETKKLQCKGGTCLGEVNPTWLKQPGDTAVALFGAGLIAYGAALCTVGYYRLATGKGKKD